MSQDEAATAAGAIALGGRQIDQLGRRIDTQNNQSTPKSQPASAPELRCYQRKILDDARAMFRGGARSVLVVSPTGSGKTVAFAHLVRAAAGRGKRIGILTHRIELIDQTSRALTRVGVDHGLIIPGAKATAHGVQIASVATLGRRLEACRDAFDLLVVDEAHHAVTPSSSRIIAANPHALILGFTATPERLDGRGLGEVFDALVEGPTTAELIEQGHLSRFNVFAPAAAPDLTGVKSKMGDFDLGDLRQKMGGVVINSAVAEYKRIAPGKRAIAFCVDIDHSKAVAAAFRAVGVAAAHLDGDTPADERRAILAALAAGDISIVTNCGLISEGFDCPAVEVAILLRPTQSLALHLQQTGRVLRPSPGKDKATILDFAGNSLRHGLPDEPRSWSLDSRPRRQREAVERRAPRRCHECGALHPQSARTCSGCGAPLITPKDRHDVEVRLQITQQAAEAAAIRRMSYAQKCRWAGVDPDRLRLVAQACGYRSGWPYRRLQEILAASKMRSAR